MGFREVFIGFLWWLYGEKWDLLLSFFSGICFLYSLWGLYIKPIHASFMGCQIFTSDSLMSNMAICHWMFLFPSQNLHFIPVSPAGHVWLPEAIGCSSGVDDMKQPNLEGLATNFENFGTWFMSNHWSLGASLTGDKTNNEDVTIMDGLVEKIDRKLFILCLQ